MHHTNFSKTYQIRTGSSRWGPSTEREKWTQGPAPNQEPVCSLQLLEKGHQFIPPDYINQSSGHGPVPRSNLPTNFKFKIKVLCKITIYLDVLVRYFC